MRHGVIAFPTYLTHTEVLGDLDKSVGHLRRVGATSDRGGLGHGEDRRTLGLEGSLLAEAFAMELLGHQ